MTAVMSWQVQNLQGGPAGWRPRAGLMLPFPLKAVCCRNLILLLERSRHFILFRPSAGWMKPIHIMRKSAFLKVHWFKYQYIFTEKCLIPCLGTMAQTGWNIKLLTIIFRKCKQRQQGWEKKKQSKEIWGCVKWCIVLLADTLCQASEITAGYSASMSGWHMVRLWKGCRDTR